MTAQTAPADVLDRASQVAKLAATAGRGDLVERMQAAAARLRRPTSVICVVGEFKQGKSSLVNALLGESVCPVDDDLATSALTLVCHGDERRVVVRRRERGELVTETVDPATLRDWVTEAANPGNVRHVERVDVRVPNELLAQGLVVVDTAGAGSLSAGRGMATLAFLPWADAVVFTSDATAELSAPELAFLRDSRQRCPTVLFALTKIDLAPEWRRIAALDAQHLRDASIDATVLPLSAELRRIAGERHDTALDATSGFPALRDAIDREVVAPAAQLESARTEADVAEVLAQLRSALCSELAILTDPARSAEIGRAAQSAVERLETLRGPGARWSTVVGDRIADLSNNVNFELRAAMRRVTRAMEDEIERLRSPKDWDELATRLQRDVAAAVTEAFRSVERGSATIEVEVLELIGDELISAETSGSGREIVDVGALWSAKPIDPEGRAAGRVFGNALTGLRGAQSGVLMFGMLARFLPATAGAMLLAAPVTLGLGAAFAGVQLFDVHKRRLAQRRQQARVNVRQFVDDVQFEVANALGEVLREAQRSLRDGLGARIAELQRTCAETARAATDSAKSDAAARGARAAQLQERLEQVDALDRRS